RCLSDWSSDVCSSDLGTVGTLKAKEAALSPEQRQAVQRKQGRAIYGVDFKIEGDDGGELPWDGTAFGDLLVKGPWVIREYFKGRSEERRVGKECIALG